jgi:polysaccharide export outer membrane protein
LLDLLSSAGGVRTDAGPAAKITRPKASGPIPHPSNRQTVTGDYVAEVDLKSLLDARNPSENIVIEPHDVVSIPPAEVIYVVGNVKKAGGFPLGGKPTLSVLQALSMAEGLDPQAAPKHSRILRRGSEPGAERTEIAVDVQKIMTGKAQDILLLPNDILFVPSSAAKSVGVRGADIAIQIATRALIWR